MPKPAWAAAVLVAFALAGGCGVAARADEAKGFAALQRMQPREALTQLTPALVADMRAGTPAARKDAANVLMLIGHSFGLDANYTSYLECAKLARQLDPENPTVIAFNIQALLRQTRLGEAGELVRQYEPLAKKNSYVARLVSDYYRSVGETKQANWYLEMARVLNPHDPVIYQIHARQVSTQPADVAHDFETAARYCETDSYRQQNMLWNEERTRLKDKVSTKWLDASERDYPEEPNWMINKALFLVSQGKTQAAVDMYTRAVSSPARISMRAFSQFAGFCAFNKMPKSARALADRAIAIAPMLPDPYLAKGHALRALGDTKGAEEAYRVALKVNPHFSMAYEALRDSPSYATGANHDWLVEQWAANCPDRADAWLLRADQLRAGKKWQEALDAYKHADERLAKAMKPPDRTVLTACHIYAGEGTSAYKLGDMQTAIASARSFNERKPAQADALIEVRPGKIPFASYEKSSKPAESADHAALADLLYEGDELDDCITEYKKAIEATDNPEWHRGLLKAYMDKHDYSSAAKEDVVVANNTVTKDMPSVMNKLKKMIGQ